MGFLSKYIDNVIEDQAKRGADPWFHDKVLEYRMSKGHSPMTQQVTEIKKGKRGEGTLHNRGSLEPWIKDEVEFRAHQVEGVKWLMPKRGALIADDMGVGKTLQVLAVFGMHIWKTARILPDKHSTMVVVVPPSIRENWQDEIEKFTRLQYRIISGTPAERVEQIKEFKEIQDNKILIINYEILKGHIAQLNALNIDVLVLDEAHKIKNFKSVTYAAVSQLRANRKFPMTGTPMLRHADDLWTVLDTATPGQWGNYYAFRHKYCIMGGYKNKQVMGIKNEKHLVAKMSQIMLRRRIEDVVDLPPVNFVRRSVSLTGRQREIYNYIVTEQKLDKYIGESFNLRDDMVRAMRLRQVCAGLSTLFANDDESSKLDLAIEDSTELVEKDEKIVVCTQYRGILASYVKRFKAANPGVPIFELHGDVPKEDRVKIVKQWEACEGGAVIIGIIKVMGVGLNMTAARYCLFVDKEFSPGINAQAVGRIKRIGSEKHKSLNVYEYFVRNSAEARIEEILNQKIKNNETIVEGASKDSTFMAQIAKAIEGTL